MCKCMFHCCSYLCGCVCVCGVYIGVFIFLRDLKCAELLHFFFLTYMVSVSLKRPIRDDDRKMSRATAISLVQLLLIIT